MTAWWRVFLTKPGHVDQLDAIGGPRRAHRLADQIRVVAVNAEGPTAATQLRAAGEALLVSAWLRATRRGAPGGAPTPPVGFDVAVTALAGLYLIDEAFRLIAEGSTRDTS
ncbi:hypothetical protein [Cellulomonas uda]|uniref:hypothetical protein n=1 Tax=Cellulomonas uda TaxID=1714 RepID=UPI0011450192|nr:hypothetical protein [Cellulomonas uda]NII67795.1 hypothetical protein [Cellulomonas uda]